MKTSNRLIAARAVIENPENWTQGWYAKTAAGEACGVDSKEAVCFCSVGALLKAGGGADRFFKHAIALLQEVSDNSVLDYNDYHTHKEVLQMFDKAIQLTQERENLNG